MRAAIIGCGPTGPTRGGSHSISYAHGWAIRDLADPRKISLVAAASRAEQNRADFQAEFPGTHMYADYREMLTQERPDFVSVCAFPPDREAMVNAALQAGAKTIWVEKPFAISMAVAHRMLQAAEAHGARLFVNFQRRFGAPFEWVKQTVGCGRIGRLVSVQINQPCNKLIDFGPHLIDAILNTIDAPATCQPVSALAGVEWCDELYQGIPVESQLIGTVHFNNGLELIVESGRNVPERAPILRFNGEEGFVEMLFNPHPEKRSVALGRLIGEPGITAFESEENFHHGDIDRNLYVSRALRDIVEAVTTGRPSRLDAQAVLPGLEILLGLFTSARDHAMVEFPLAEQNSPFPAAK